MNRELPSHQNLALMVVLALVLSFIALNLVVVWPSIQMAITGKHFIVYRDDWGTGDWRLLYNAEKQRIRITPEKPLQEWRDFFICPTFPEDWYPYSMSDFPPLSKNREIWIFEYEGDRSPPWMYFTVYTNPRLDNPRRRITNVYETQEKGQKLQLISDSYVYLGYAVRDIEDVQALQDFR